MKKLFLFLFAFALIAPIGLFAQPVPATKIIKGNDHFFTFPILSSDVADATGEVISKTYDLKNLNAYQYFYITADLDTISHAAILHKSVNVVLAGSYDGGRTYTAITTVPYHATADTVIPFASVTTATLYSNLKVTVTGLDSLSVQLMSLDIKIGSIWHK